MKMWGLILIASCLIIAGIILVVPGEPTQRLSTMLNILILMVMIYTLWIEIPNLIRTSSSGQEELLRQLVSLQSASISPVSI
jgi:hypothetical protein